jgi:hypothetical protein
MRLTKQFAKSVALIAMVLFGRIAEATPISYDEAISGDLSDPFGSLATTFALDVGANTVTGTIHVISAAPVFDADFDGFAVIVPAGTHLTNLSYAFQTALVPGSTGATVGYSLNTGNVYPSGTFLAGSTIDLLGSTVQPFNTALPLGAGTFEVYETSSETFAPPDTPSGYTTNYIWTLTVAADQPATPEPASMLLLGTGLVGIGARCWRNRLRG